MAPSLNYLTRRNDGVYTSYSHWLAGTFTAERAGLGWVMRFEADDPENELHRKVWGESRLTDCDSLIRTLEYRPREEQRKAYVENVRQAREAERIKVEQEKEERLRVNSHRDHEFAFILNLDTASAVGLAAYLMNRVPSDLSDTAIEVRIRSAGGDEVFIDAGIGRSITATIHDSVIRKHDQQAELIA